MPVLALSLWGGSLPAAGADGAIRLVVDDREVTPDVPPVLAGGRVLVPLRWVSEALGLEVAWDEPSRTATIRSPRGTVELRAGSRIARVSGSLRAIDVPPRITAGRMLVPLRTMAVLTGAGVAWDEATRTARVTSPAEAPDAGSAPAAPAGGGGGEPPGGPVYDLVIRGGRVMDPETRFDQVANVGLSGDRVTVVTAAPIRGRVEIEATGLVVAPGFIDLLSFDPNPYGIWYKIGDGVTTNLGMHGLAVDAAAWFRRWEAQRPPAHYGGAFSYNHARAQLGISPYRAATPQEVEKLVRLAEAGLQGGWIGIDMSLEYAPGTSFAEVLAMARVARKYRVPLFFHARYSDMMPPGTNFDALQEIIRAARETGASVHVEHIASTGGTFSMAQSLALLAEARAEGIDVTACVYPYNFWATYLGSARFDPGWQERFRISYGDLEIPGTGERLTPETFRRYRAQNKVAVAYAIPEDDVRTALRTPWVMVASDSILEPGNNNHPRAAGTFSRLLGKYVREEQVLSLMDALAKITILPARRLEGQVPALRTKGRLRAGMDADITIFDPETVRDQATVSNPAQFAAGIEWVLVAGQIVKDPDGVRRDVRPGRPIRPDFSNLSLAAGS